MHCEDEFLLKLLVPKTQCISNVLLYTKSKTTRKNKEKNIMRTAEKTMELAYFG